MNRNEPESGKQRRREPRREDDYEEFERQTGYAGERAYSSGWRPAWESGFSIDGRPERAHEGVGRYGGPSYANGPGLEDRGTRGSQVTWRPASPPSSAGTGEHRGKGPKGYRRSDARIEEDVCDRLTDDGDVDATDLLCSVKDGEVTLSGMVRTRPEKRRAEELAESVSGVVDVQNQIRVRRDGSAAAGTHTTNATNTTGETNDSKAGTVGMTSSSSAPSLTKPPAKPGSGNGGGKNR